MEVNPACIKTFEITFQLRDPDGEGKYNQSIALDIVEFDETTVVEFSETVAEEAGKFFASCVELGEFGGG